MATLRAAIDASGASTGSAQWVASIDRVRQSSRAARGDVAALDRSVFDYGKRAEVATGQTDQLSGRVGILGGVARQAGLAVAGALSVTALIGGARTAIGVIADYEQGLVSIGKTADLQGAPLRALGQDLLDLSTKPDVSSLTGELLDVAQAAGSLGVTGAANILKYTETVAKLGTASDLYGAEAAQTLARLQTVTGENAETVDVLASVVVRLGNEFAATEREIAGAATRVAQATAAFDVSSAEAAALGTTLQSLGVEAELGGTEVGRAFRAIDEGTRNGGPQLAAFAEIAGVSAERFTQAWQRSNVEGFQLFVAGLGDIVSEGGSASEALAKIGLSGERSEQVYGSLAAAQGTLAEALAVMADELEHTNALNEEASRGANTLRADWTRLINTAYAYTVSLGQAGVGGALREVVQSGTDVLRALAGVEDGYANSETAARAFATALEVGVFGLTAYGAGLAGIKLLEFIQRGVQATATVAQGTLALAEGRAELISGTIAEQQRAIALRDAAAAQLGKTQIEIAAIEAARASALVTEEQATFTVRAAEADHQAAVAAQARAAADLQAQRAELLRVQAGQLTFTSFEREQVLGGQIAAQRAVLAAEANAVAAAEARVAAAVAASNIPATIAARTNATLAPLLAARTVQTDALAAANARLAVADAAASASGDLLFGTLEQIGKTLFSPTGIIIGLGILIAYTTTLETGLERAERRLKELTLDSDEGAEAITGFNDAWKEMVRARASGDIERQRDSFLGLIDAIDEGIAKMEELREVEGSKAVVEVKFLADTTGLHPDDIQREIEARFAERLEVSLKLGEGVPESLAADINRVLEKLPPIPEGFLDRQLANRLATGDKGEDVFGTVSVLSGARGFKEGELQALATKEAVEKLLATTDNAREAIAALFSAGNFNAAPINDAFDLAHQRQVDFERSLKALPGAAESAAKGAADGLKGLTEAQIKARTALAQLLEGMREEVELAGKSEEERERAIAQRRAEDGAIAAGIVKREDNTDAVLAGIHSREDLQRVIDGLVADLQREHAANEDETKASAATKRALEDRRDALGSLSDELRATAQESARLQGALAGISDAELERREILAAGVTAAFAAGGGPAALQALGALAAGLERVARLRAQLAGSDAAKGQAEYLEQLRQETAAIGRSREEMELANIVREAQEIVTRDGGEAVEGFVAKVFAEVVAQQRLREEADRGTDALERWNDVRANVASLRDDLDFEYELLGKTNDQREKAIVLRQLEADTARALGISIEEAREQMAEERAEIEERLELLQKARHGEEFARALADPLGGAAEEIVTDLTRVEDALESIGRAIQRNILNVLVTRPFTEFLTSTLTNLAIGAGTGATGGGGSTGGGGEPAAPPPQIPQPPSADGGNITVEFGQGAAFGHGQEVSPFALGEIFIGGRAVSHNALGQVYGSPTYFGFERDGEQRLGVMAERGEEAVMPLARTAGGELGVRVANPGAGGGGGGGGGGGHAIGAINQTFNFPAGSVDDFRANHSQVQSLSQRGVNRFLGPG